eukprot:gene20498-26592_t
MYLAIDGVAPRAKMNQRNRRFRSSKERDILLSEYILKEGKLPTEESFDSNCITPGTEFMYRLGPDEPGEGEHKVMDMIRKIQKENTINNIDKNTLKHCMYGLDADLIIIKEKVEIERVIDDFVFTCFFIGNDFLPSLPHLDIADGSLNLMMNIYKDLIPKLGGYLTDKNSIHLPRLELFIQEVARREPLYFQQRAIDDKEPGFADEGYREFYYKSKFGIDVKDTVAIRNIVQSYIEGLVWLVIS